MRKFISRAAGAFGLTALASSAMAAVDTAAVGTALTNAQTSAEGVGGMVIAVVAGLVVVGVIIGLVKKV